VIRFFSGNNPLNLFVLLFLGVALKLPYFLSPMVPVMSKTDGFLYLQLLRWLQAPGLAFPYIYPLIAYLFLFTQAVALNSFVNDNRFFSNPQFLTGFAYLLLSSLVPEWNTVSPVLLINTILIIALQMMTGLYHKQQVKGNLFNIGFGLGICSFIYFPSVYMLVLLIIALAMFRPIQITEWLVTLAGVITPFYFLLVYFFVWDQWERIKEIVPAHQLSLPSVVNNWQTIVMVTLVLLPAFIGWLLSNRYASHQGVQGRKNWALIFYYLLIALLIPFINNYSGLHHFILALVPLSIYASAFYTLPSNKKIVEYSIWLSFGWIVWQYLST
jgi:hypothetical protein